MFHAIRPFDPTGRNLPHPWLISECAKSTELSMAVTLYAQFEYTIIVPTTQSMPHMHCGIHVCVCVCVFDVCRCKVPVRLSFFDLIMRVAHLCCSYSTYKHTYILKHTQAHIKQHIHYA